MAAPAYSVMVDGTLNGSFDNRPAAEASFQSIAASAGFTDKLELVVSRVLASASKGVVVKKSRPQAKRAKKEKVSA